MKGMSKKAGKKGGGKRRGQVRAISGDMMAQPSMPTLQDRIGMRADSAAHEMAQLHPTYRKLHAGIKKQMIGMMSATAKGKGMGVKGKRGFGSRTGQVRAVMGGM